LASRNVDEHQQSSHHHHRQYRRRRTRARDAFASRALDSGTLFFLFLKYSTNDYLLQVLQTTTTNANAKNNASSDERQGSRQIASRVVSSFFFFFLVRFFIYVFLYSTNDYLQVRRTTTTNANANNNTNPIGPMGLAFFLSELFPEKHFDLVNFSIFLNITTYFEASLHATKGRQAGKDDNRGTNDG
jgi:hypothetical protein